MTLMLRRISLVEQVADVLRHDLLGGRWRDRLPGEHQLSDLLHVSRSTLRLALDVLRREGLIRVSRGERWSVSCPSRLPPPASASNIIGLVASLPLHEHSARAIIIVDELRRHLQESGFTLQLHVVLESGRRAGPQRLEALVQETKAACWILWSCSAEVQRWFAARPLRTIVQGSCHERVDLPFFRVDGAAACHHATALLRHQGHRRIALLLPRSPQYAGTLEIKHSFHQACTGAGAPCCPVVLHLESGASAVESALAELMRDARRPTALVVMMPAHTLTAHCHLLHSGIRLPRDVSLIAAHDDLYLDHVTPTLTRYRFNHSNYARRMSRIVLKLAQSGTRPRSITMYPAFQNGATHGPAPSGEVTGASARRVEPAIPSSRPAR